RAAAPPRGAGAERETEDRERWQDAAEPPRHVLPGQGRDAAAAAELDVIRAGARVHAPVSAAVGDDAALGAAAHELLAELPLRAHRAVVDGPVAVVVEAVAHLHAAGVGLAGAVIAVGAAAAHGRKGVAVDVDTLHVGHRLDDGQVALIPLDPGAGAGA